jgi:uncharacterized membrane protein
VSGSAVCETSAMNFDLGNSFGAGLLVTILVWLIALVLVIVFWYAVIRAAVGAALRDHQYWMEKREAKLAAAAQKSYVPITPQPPVD